MKSARTTRCAALTAAAASSYTVRYFLPCSGGPWRHCLGRGHFAWMTHDGGLPHSTALATHSSSNGSRSHSYSDGDYAPAADNSASTTWLTLRTTRCFCLGALRCPAIWWTCARFAGIGSGTVTLADRGQTSACLGTLSFQVHRQHNCCPWRPGSLNSALRR